MCYGWFDGPTRRTDETKKLVSSYHFRIDCTLLKFGPKSGKMRVFVILSCAVVVAVVVTGAYTWFLLDLMMANADPYYDNFIDPGNYDHHTPEYVGPTYGPDVVRDGFCPRTPEFGICDAHECAKDNHCENSAMKCCISSCWFMMCRDAVPGEK